MENGVCGKRTDENRAFAAHSVFGLICLREPDVKTEYYVKDSIYR